MIIDPKVDIYCKAKSTPPSKYCEAILKYTQAHVAIPQMLIGELEASFLRFLLQLVQAKRVLEIGCYTGYSALAMAEVLPKSGKVVTLDIDPVNTALARKFWAKSPDGRKIKLILGPARKTISTLKRKFDFVFIDADKVNYLHYLKFALSLLSKNGMIAVDNCLWGGEVVRKSRDEQTIALQKFNDYVSDRKDLEVTLAPIRDGIFLIRKKV